MSKTFASRSTVVSGRGRGTVNRHQNTLGAGMNMAQREQFVGVGAPPRVSAETELNGPQTPSQEIGQRMIHQGAYTVITPNPKKRQEVTQVQQREEQLYQAHKQANTAKSFSYVGTTGGGTLSHAEARQKIIQTIPTKTQKLIKLQEQKTYFKRKEEEEIQKRKDEQRQKSVMNKLRNDRVEQAQDEKWEEQRKRTNDAFLRRLENQSKKKLVEKSSTNQLVTASGSLDPFQTPEDNSGTLAMAAPNSGSIGLNSESLRKLEALSVMFPQYSRAYLHELLQQADYSMDTALLYLQDD